jgi:hypothetical protein
MWLKIIAAISGILLGIINARYLFVGSAFSLILWGLAGLIIGYFSLSRKMVLIDGAVYGFCLGFVFMLAGYAGAAPWTSHSFFFIIIGLVAAVCGSISACFGNLLRRAILKKR